MAATKQLLRHPIVVDLVGRFAARYVRIVWAWSRWRIDDPKQLAELTAAGRPAIICFWHGRMLIALKLAFGLRAAPITAVTSRHRDGMLIARMLRYLGIASIAGSTGRGGAGALIGTVRLLRRGESVIFTPDGPRGPRMRAAPGAVVAAKLSGIPLLPVAGGLKPCRILKTWDRFLLPLPLPLSRGMLRIGKPIEVPADAGREEIDRLRRRLEDEMIRLCRDVDTALGLPVTEPATDMEPSRHGVS